jgi:WD40 repeat protein
MANASPWGRARCTKPGLSGRSARTTPLNLKAKRTVVLWNVASRQRGARSGAQIPRHGGVQPRRHVARDRSETRRHQERRASAWETRRRHTDPVTFCLSAPTVLAATGHDKTVILWNVASRQPVGARSSMNSVTSVGFSPDGTLLATGATTRR